MAAHTPGPWEAECRDVGYSGGKWDRGNFLQWEVYGPDEPAGRGSFYQQDAFLIAAAPELLAALEMLLESHDKSCQGEHCQIYGVDLARAAVSKAKGE